jgi:hypothetical protein
MGFFDFDEKEAGPVDAPRLERPSRQYLVSVSVAAFRLFRSLLERNRHYSLWSVFARCYRRYLPA